MSRYFKLLPSLLIVIVGTFALTPSIAQTNNEEPGLRKFIERMLSFSRGDTKVMVGKLPEKMPVELPIPSESQILGSTVDGQGNIQIVLDVSQSVEQVTDFYKNKLENSGWKQPISISTFNSGFVATRSEFGEYTTFCNNANKSISLVLNITEPKVTPTAVSLSINKIDEKDKYNNSCKDNSTINIFEGKVQFPVLTPPLDAEVLNQSYETSNSSFAFLQTKLDSKTLANHYIQQLEKAGWKKIDNGQSNSSSWSIWKFKDEKGKNWQALMSFTQVEGKSDQYFANLQALQL